jgi:tRNA A-37 threonylcarbamoyl transferase component Bud32
MSCLDDNEAAAFVQGLMGPEAAQRVEGHLESCSTCRGLMIDFAQAFGPPPVADDTDPATPTEAPPIRRGDRLDRYVVLECVGTGGMSTVYSAYDPELDRKVALKVLRVASAEASVDEPYRQDRMLIEARAIARLSHPNVVSVFDARLLQGDLFIAMELVEGETLRHRLDRGVSDWREALALCSAAGRGLAAAHRAGIVHRDFKPENVLIGNDGRVRVADFGLATEVGASETAPIPSPSASTSSSLPQGLTRTGFVLGTPMYMAPEQMEGADPTPGGDQYSLCLVCFEALFGQRPFAAATFEDLLARRREERMLALARPRGLPRSLEDALRRGLRAEPGERWPSVDALLEALELPRSRTASWIGLGVVGAAAAVVLGARTIDTDAPHCDRGSFEIAEAWNPDVRRGMQARGAAGSGPQLLTRLDTWSADWAEAYDRACRATWIDHVQSEALLDRRIACLQRRRRELSTLVALLLDDEPTFRGHEAIEAIDMAACADMERLLRSDGTIEPAMAHAVDQARDRVERARVHREAGHYTEALALAREGQAAADATHHPATRAEAWVEHRRASGCRGSPGPSGRHRQRCG